MIVYLDTSALLKIYVQEEHRDIVAAALHGATSLALSVVAYPEARSAFARKLREGSLTQRSHAHLVAALDRDWSRYNRVQVTSNIALRAGHLAEDLGLRGFDAIHVASALRVQEQQAEPVHFLTFDARLMDAARQVMPVFEWEE